ncbi:MAG TPA: ABC transporter substrate-binding protein [Methylomirabilota bacterium]
MRAVAALVIALLAAPAAAAAQVPRIGFISTTSPGTSPANDAFQQGLRELGYVEGQSIAIEWRWGRGKTDRFPEFAAELVRLKVDVIVTANDLAGRAAQKVTKTIPIVVAVMGDPVGSGLVATLARPGGNVTGLSPQSSEIAAKRLQLLREALPTVARVALLADTSDANYRPIVRESEVAARALSLQLSLQEVSSPSELTHAFASIAKEGVDAVSTVGGTMFYANRERLAEEALKRRLPMMCAVKEHVEAGCLMSYSMSLRDLFRRAAYLVDRILKGAKPADLPVEQASTFELAVNVKTARTLGLTMPPALLLRADHVIE